jgi:hypothetical protein
MGFHAKKTPITAVSVVCLCPFAIYLVYLQLNQYITDRQDENLQETVPEKEKAVLSNPLRIQIASDLHLEFYAGHEFPPDDDIIVPSAERLALIGDIGLAFDANLASFLHRQADRFVEVFYVAGNHEFYNHGRQEHSVVEQLEWIRNVCSQRANLHFLEQSVLERQGVRILATSLWSHVPIEFANEAANFLNDYQLSFVVDGKGDGLRRKLRPSDTNQWHAANVAWLQKEIEGAPRNQSILVLTHHTPMLLGTSNPRYEGNPMTHCFSTD